LFGEMGELFLGQLRGLPEEELTTVIRQAVVEAADESPESAVAGDARTLLVCEFNLFVALDVRDGSLDDLTFWSRRAIMSARTLDALVKRTVAGWVAETLPDERFALRAHVTLAPEFARDVLDLIETEPGPNAALLKLFHDADHSTT
jgi:hypothetical protein